MQTDKVIANPKTDLCDSAFTRVELLVVVSLAALLFLLQISSLASTQVRGHATGCLNNLRQLALAWQMYAADYNGSLAPNNSGGYPNGPPGSESWVYGDVQVDISTINIQLGCLFPYAKSTAVYKCPADPSRNVRQGTNYPRTRSYSMSSSMQNFKKLSDIRNPPPVRALVFMDEADSVEIPFLGSINDGNIGLRQYPDVSWGDAPSKRHNNGANLALADGHVEAWRWQSGYKPFAARTPATPEEIPDLRRIQTTLPGSP